MRYFKIIQVSLLGLSLLIQVACVTQQPYISDAELQRNVELAVNEASDLPPRIRIEVSSGVVRVFGSLACENCGGSVTPGQLGTIQQSLGAVIRAVPGVMNIEFAFDPV